MKKIIMLVIVGFLISGSSCYEKKDQSNNTVQGAQIDIPQNIQYSYYQLLGTYLNDIDTRNSYRYSKELYDKNVFRPITINTIKAKHESILKIAFNRENGILPVTQYSIHSLTPNSLFNFLFYVDDKEQLYFSERSDADAFLTQYMVYTNDGKKLGIKHINVFYEYLEDNQNLPSIFFDVEYGFYANSDYFYLADNVRTKIKTGQLMELIRNGKTENYEFPKERIGSEIFYNAKTEKIL